MRSCSETSYTTKVANAKKLLALLKRSANYLPSSLQPIMIELETTTTLIKDQNALIILKKQQYSYAVENLKQLFIQREDSVRKRLSQIGAYIKTTFGKTAPEALAVSQFISGIRGANRAHNVGNSSIKNNINQAYLSYTSQIRLFAELINYLENLGNDYNPTCHNLSILALKTIREKASNANDMVMVTYSEFLLLKNNRSEACTRLSRLALEIKVGLKQIDKIHSTEFRIFKTLKL